MNYIHTADSRMVEAVEALPALTDDRKVRPLRETALEQTIAAPEGQNIEAEKGSAGETTLTAPPTSKKLPDCRVLMRPKRRSVNEALYR